MDSPSDRREARGLLTFIKAIERASKEPKVPPALRGALRALAAIRRRSGNDPNEARISDEEKELRRLLGFVSRGDAEACSKASGIVRRLLTNQR